MKVLMYVTGALIPPNPMEITAALKLREWEAKKAIEYWKWQGILKHIKGELFHINQLN
jgi:hypothetical protein